MVTGRAALAFLLAALVASGWCSPGDLDMRLSPVFDGSQKSEGLMPVRVSLSNSGPDARGSVHVEDNGYEMDYPVELPHDSLKDLIVFVQGLNVYGESEIVLQTDHGAVRRPLDVAVFTPSNGDTFLEIGGNPGDLGFLSAGQSNATGGPQTGAAYVAAENAPDRLAAYAGFQMIILASGSERLSDGAVRALRLFVLRGGLLVIPGGVASPLLSDGRWNGLVPIRPREPKVIDTDDVLRELASKETGSKTVKGVPVGASYSTIDFDPLPGTKVLKERGHNLIASRTYGCGRVVFWGFDPFQGAVRNWGNRSQFFRRSAHQPMPGEPSVISPQVASTNPPGRTSTVYPAGGGFRIGPDESPFQVQMPSGGSVALILGIYFLCVIPINFYVLHKLRRRELAWTTGAAISLIFAGIMLGQAKALYSLPTSTSDRTVVIAQQGSPAALALGHAQMFFSNGGTYDLKMEGVDSIQPAQQQNGYGRTEDSSGGLQMFSPHDVGEVKMDSADVGNLAFGEFSYEQVVEADWMRVERHGADYVVKTSIPFSDATLETPEGWFGIGPMDAGASTTIRHAQLVKNNGIFETPENQATNDAMAQVAKTLPWVKLGEVALIAEAPTLPVGPSVGKRVAPNPILVYFARPTP